MGDATRCKVCGGPFSKTRVFIDGLAYHQRCSMMSHPSHTWEDYSRLSDRYSMDVDALMNACKRALIDLGAAKLLAQHTLGEPHGINQTIAIIEAALSQAGESSSTPEPE